MESKSVSVKLIPFDDPNLYTDTADGGYSITTKDGRTVTVTGAIPDGAKLVVRQVTKDDKDAWEWFSKSTKNIGNDILPFDIYFVDSDGNEIAISGEIIITITLPKGYKTPVVCYLSTDGSTTLIDSNEKDGTLTFKTTHNSYYVLAEKKGSISTDASPQTGNNSHISLWIATLIISGSAAIFSAVKSYRKTNA